MRRSCAFWHRALTVVTCLLVLAAALACLSGCRVSEKLKEVIYDQTADLIEYDNEDKFFINDSTAEEESTRVPALETSENAPASDEKQNLVVYSSKPNHDEYTAKKSIFAKYPDFKGLEASEGVTLQYSDSEDAIDHEVPHDEPEVVEEWDEVTQVVNAQSSVVQEDTTQVGGGSDSNTQSNSGGDEGWGGTGGDGAADDEWESVDTNNNGETNAEEGQNQAAEDEEGGGAGGETTVIDTTGAFTEPPKADTIAAFGEAAIIVQMLGGQGALAAADAETLDEGFMTVFGDEGASQVAVGWSDKGTAGKIDADAIVASGAKTILVYASDYKDSIPPKELRKLNQAGITFTVIPALINSTYIKQAVTTIGDILAESESIGNAGQTTAIAADYVTFHDNLVNACLAANGGLLASANSTVYETKSTAGYVFNDGANYTLLIDGYDSSASYAQLIGGWKPACNGAAMTTLGYSASPVSFYIQVGGLVNNAAALSSSGESEHVVAWQFNTNILPADKKYWDYSSDGLMANSANISSAKAEGWRRTVFNTGLDAASNGAGCSFGSSRFPKVIVADATIRDSMVANSADADGLYHPYALNVAQEGGFQINAIGPLVNNSTIVYSSIGVDAGGSTTEWSGNSIPVDAFAVNPKGLVGSWISGGVESVLEAAWVNDVVAANPSTVDYRAYVSQFYAQFFRYTLSAIELAQIVGD